MVTLDMVLLLWFWFSSRYEITVRFFVISLRLVMPVTICQSLHLLSNNGLASTPSLQPESGHQRSICRGVLIFEPEFFTIQTDFLQGRRRGWYFFSAPA